MATKKKAPVIPIKRNPLMQGHKGLTFDNLSEEELVELTDAQKADKWMSKWLLNVDPFTKYPKFFKNNKSNTGEYDLVLSFIKKFYTHFVIKNDWSEVKYTFVINDILETRGTISKERIELGGRNYDKGSLASQRRLKRRRNGRQ